jgi:hypothetical protein
MPLLLLLLVRRRLPLPRHPPPAHPFLHSAHQRQSRALHPDRPARMGRPSLSIPRAPAELQPWLHDYNWHRPHPMCGQSPPISRAGFSGEQRLETPQLAADSCERAAHVDACTITSSERELGIADFFMFRVKMSSNSIDIIGILPF